MCKALGSKVKVESEDVETKRGYHLLRFVCVCYEGLTLLKDYSHWKGSHDGNMPPSRMSFTHVHQLFGSSTKGYEEP